jgi:post-segregation antitoxin (ccd killing protein)
MTVPMYEGRQTAKDGGSGAAEPPLNVLVIHEMLHELRAQGHNVVRVARSGVNRERHAARVEAVGIAVYCPDPESKRSSRWWAL